MTQTLCHDRPVLLNREQRCRRRIRPSTGFGFARRATSLYLAGIEFNEACKDDPIVFTRRPQGQIAPVVVLGLQRFQAGHQRTQAFCRRLEELELLVEMRARADLLDGRTFTVAGPMVVDENKLQQLPDATVLSLFRSGELHPVSMHLLSLSNLNRLVQRIAEPGTPAVPSAPRPGA